MFKYKSTRWKRFQPSGKYCHHEEDFEIEKDFDHFDDPILPNVNSAVGNIWLELREHFNAATKATCFIAEKMSQIIDSDWKLFSSVLRKSFVESGTSEKSLSNFVQNKKELIEPQELIIGFDPDT